MRSPLKALLPQLWDSALVGNNFLVPLVANRVPKEVPVFEGRFCVDFRCEPPPWGRGRRRERVPSGGMVKRHLASKSIKNMWGNHTFAKVAFPGPLGEGNY